MMLFNVAMAIMLKDIGLGFLRSNLKSSFNSEFANCDLSFYVAFGVTVSCFLSGLSPHDVKELVSL